jgi:hypothetical protein
MTRLAALAVVVIVGGCVGSSESASEVDELRDFVERPHPIVPDGYTMVALPGTERSVLVMRYGKHDPAIHGFTAYISGVATGEEGVVGDTANLDHLVNHWPTNEALAIRGYIQLLLASGWTFASPMTFDGHSLGAYDAAWLADHATPHDVRVEVHVMAPPLAAIEILLSPHRSLWADVRYCSDDGVPGIFADPYDSYTVEVLFAHFYIVTQYDFGLGPIASHGRENYCKASGEPAFCW